ncbi:hypothetical protein LCGC14_0913330 [marine sediment metagenome]|uniref:Uncharacterized protein n=1 Tax=marine sediment metagenome TaxID=412755 RepID=A0A0F9NXL9_9ZZZZ
MPIEDLNRVAKAQTEFKDFMYQVNGISRSDLTKEEKRAGLRKGVDDLSENAYIQHFDQLLQIIQSSKKNCEPYEDSESQVISIIEWLPRLEGHRELVLLIIQERRKNYKLKV